MGQRGGDGGPWAPCAAGGSQLRRQPLPGAPGNRGPPSHVLHPCWSPPKFQGWEVFGSGLEPRPQAQPPCPRPHPLSMCSLFVPVVNLEKMSGLPKPDGPGVRVTPPSAFLSQPGSLTKDSPGKPPAAPPPKELPGRESIRIPPGEGPSHRADGSPPEKEPGGARLPPKTHRKMARE